MQIKVNSNTQLTSAEIGNLWTTYMNNKMVNTTMTYFREKCGDIKTRLILDYALNVTQKAIKEIEGIFSQEGYPVPHGFSKEDVNEKVDRLYTDNFSLSYVMYLAKGSNINHFTALSISTRPDVINFFIENISSMCEMYKRVATVLVEKGLYIKSPTIEINKEIDYVQKENFLAGWVGKRRILNTAEISNLFINIQTNIVGKALLTGFGQVAKSQAVRQYMIKGSSFAEKQVETLSAVLREDGLPASITWDTFVTDSTVSPFSDKLMVFHVTTLCASAAGFYGLAVTNSLRHDIQTKYVRLAAEFASYAGEGLSILIENGWLEQPPQPISHEALARV